MNLDYFKENLRYRKEVVPTAMIGIAVLCGLLILVKVTGFFVASARAENVVRRAKAQSQADPKVVEAQLARSKPIADRLRTNNLFSPPPPKQHPIKDVYAVFGDEVLIGDKWYKVGDKVADAKIVDIGPTSVTTEWDGKKQVFYPIEATIAMAQGPGKGQGPQSLDGKPIEGAGGDKGAEAANREGRPPELMIRMGPGGPGGMDFGAMRDRFQNMSEAERDRFREEMRQRAERFGFGGRGGPGGDRGRDFGGRR